MKIIPIIELIVVKEKATDNSCSEIFLELIIYLSIERLLKTDNVSTIKIAATE